MRSSRRKIFRSAAVCNSQQAGQLTSGQREFQSTIDRTAGRSMTRKRGDDDNGGGSDGGGDGGGDSDSDGDGDGGGGRWNRVARRNETRVYNP
ncbi:hypothetical protein ALC57_08578 [Trachymyrmex cornetzi]|uniref:Uncharacterized protein n=1 Tax=Trachymyrmex cornetzi TaxID=471704 RepID=A0A151J6W4_9HYME|nr:hypothetical protein ALC57_08578 [Trachymyrmex cornetzi]